MAVFVEGVAGIGVFYVVVLALGLWARTRSKDSSQEEMMLAGRSLGLLVSTLSLAATWTGGSSINAIASMMFTRGFAWCEMPIGYTICLILAPILYVGQIRKAQFLTILDPVQNVYGSFCTILMYIPCLIGDLLWIASILSSLGSALEVILGLDKVICVIVSSIFAVAYTVVGGLYSVSYTDCLQLVLFIFGLVLSVPFAYTNPAVHMENVTETQILGSIEPEDTGLWIDTMLMLIFGGVTTQAYFQRALSMKETKYITTASVGSVIISLIIFIPAGMMGVAAKGADWASLPGFTEDMFGNEGDNILPLTMRFLTPTWVAFFGLGAISASVMSSADCSLLGNASLITRNLYQQIIRPKASDTELVWVLRVSIVLVAVVSTGMSLIGGSIYSLGVLCSDLAYVLWFPHLVLVLKLPRHVNKYGCVTSFILGLLIRLSGGEKGLGIPALVKYPMFNLETMEQRFPLRTFSMLCVVVIALVVSYFTRGRNSSATKTPEHVFHGRQTNEVK